MDYIRKNYDVNVTHNVEKGKYGLINYARVLYDDEDFIETGLITFRDKDFTSDTSEYRAIHFFYSSTNTYENEDYYIGLEKDYPGVTDTVYNEGTTITLRSDDRAIAIIKDIVENLGGGWLDEDDCDDIPYKKINPINDFKPKYSKKTLIFNADKE